MSDFIFVGQTKVTEPKLTATFKLNMDEELVQKVIETFKKEFPQFKDDTIEYIPARLEVVKKL